MAAERKANRAGRGSFGLACGLVAGLAAAAIALIAWVISTGGMGTAPDIALDLPVSPPELPRLPHDPVLPPVQPPLPAPAAG